MTNYRAAVRHLKRTDPVMGSLIARVGPCRFGKQTDHSHFHHLTRAIVYQQLSGKAAATIHRRFLELFDGRSPEAEEVLDQPETALRGCGLSTQKTRYVRDLAGHVRDASLKLDRIHALPDDEVIAALTRVKGIGRWSAQMFLMFRLGRPDVLPDGDLGIQNAVRRAYGLRSLPAPRRVRRIGAPWSPWATIASWYLWRSIDGPAG